MKIIIGIKNFLEKFIPRKAHTKSIIVSTLREEIYFKSLALYVAVSYLASAFAKCEFKVYENFKEVKNEDYFRLNLSPNINETATQFKYKIIEKMYYEKEALVIESDGNLYCVDSYSTEEFPFLGNRYTNIRVGTVSLNRSYKADEVFLFKLENDDVKKLIDGVYIELGKIMAHAVDQYKRANTEKYKLKISQTKVGDEEFLEEYENDIKKELADFLTGDKAVYPEFDGYELSALTSNNKTTKDVKDIIELKNSIFETVAQAMKIPKGLLEGNITNINDVTKTLITFGIDPLASTVEEEFTRKQGYSNWKDGNYIKVDTSTINHIDVLDVAEKVDKLISSGTMCVDEVREIIGRQALNTEFSKTHFITKNYETSENALKGGENIAED